MGNGAGLKKYWVWAHLFFLAFSSSGSHAVEAPSVPIRTLEDYTQSVLADAQTYFNDWIFALKERIPHTPFIGLQLHFLVHQELKLQARARSWLFGRGKWKYLPRPSTSMLSRIEHLAENQRRRWHLDMQPGGSPYPWKEGDFLALEKILIVEMEDRSLHLEALTDQYVSSTIPPSDWEMRLLFEQYLELWTLGALLEIESGRFASAFLWGGHQKELQKNHSETLFKVSECRVALLRFSHYFPRTGEAEGAVESPWE